MYTESADVVRTATCKWWRLIVNSSVSRKNQWHFSVLDHQYRITLDSLDCCVSLSLHFIVGKYSILCLIR